MIVIDHFVPFGGTFKAQNIMIPNAVIVASRGTIETQNITPFNRSKPYPLVFKWLQSHEFLWRRMPGMRPL
jgi:hypothetical protein